MNEKAKTERKMAATEILKKPYARLITPDEDGSFFAEIVEFPGCFATGKTAAEALENVESVAIDWINTTIDQGQDIPEPMEANDFSGKLVLRMTKGLHKRAALWSEREGVSLNQFITTCLAEAVGERARQSFVLAQPYYQAMANWLFQSAPIANSKGTATISQHGVFVLETNQIATGTGPALVGLPVTERPKQYEGVRWHG